MKQVNIRECSPLDFISNICYSSVLKVIIKANQIRLLVNWNSNPDWMAKKQLNVNFNQSVL